MPQFPRHPGRGPDTEFRPTPAFPVTVTVVGVTPNSGRTPGGTAVTITGTNFSGSPTVTFDGVSATSIVVVNSTTITCVTPAGTAGIVDVVVSTATLFGGFTYIEGVVIALSPAYGPIAGGTRVNIQGYNFLTGSTITFDGVAATDVTFIDSEHFSCLTPAHATGYVDVVVTEPSSVTVTKRGGFQFTLLTRGDDIRRQPGIVIRDVLNNTPNSCNFTVDGTSNVPLIGEKIEIIDSEDGDRLLFAGTVQSVEQVYEGLTDQLAWNVQCIDFTWLMNRQRPFKSYKATSASDIVKDLIATYAPGFTATKVQTNLAKVTAVFDGSKDLATCFNEIAAAIGGGHWYVDYTQDLHFFHTVPPGLELPPSAMGSGTSHMTVAEGAGGSQAFTPGYYFFRHTFVYSDGSESSLQAISNLIQLTGSNTLSFTGIPTGADPGSLTCVARRIYYTRFISPWAGRGKLIPSKLETINQFVQVNDNVTTAFTTTFGTQGASTTAVIAIPANTAIPVAQFNGHPAGPVAGPSATLDTVSGSGFWMGGSFAFKVAFLYRDGSMSFPSPASNTVTQLLTYGQGIMGYNLTNMPIGPDVSDLDCVARIIYHAQASLTNPNYQESRSTPYPDGYVWPVGFKEVNWSEDASDMVCVLPDNTSTSFLQFQLGYFGDPATSTAYAGKLVGYGNTPYGNANDILSSDPLPIWPNNDGPSLEDDDPPADLTDDNDDLLHEDSGSQAFVVSTDLSQVRNRVYVIGSGSTVAVTALVGDTKVQVADVASFSPTGGQVRILDPGTNTQQVLIYTGVTGVPGKAYITLSSSLSEALVQGSTLFNFFQADDIESQKYLGKVELDVNGNKTDGVHEYTVTDSSLKARFQLYMRAYAELELFSKPLVTIRYATRDPKSRSGQTVTVDLSNPPCQGDFLIQDVTIDQIHDESDGLFPRYTVTATSSKFELNDLLLQIIGGQIGGGSVSGAGVVAAATTSSVTGSTTPRPPVRAWGTVNCGPQGNGVLTYGEPTTSTTTGTASAVVDDNNTYRRITATTGDGLEGFNAGVILAADFYTGRMYSLPYLEVVLRTGSSTGSCRYWAGMHSGGSIPQGNDTPKNSGVVLDGIGVGKSQSSSYWTFYHSVANSVSPPYVASREVLLPILASTLYRIRLQVTSASTVTVTINDYTATFSFTPFLAATLTTPCCSMNALANTRFFDFVSMYYERGLNRSIVG